MSSKCFSTLEIDAIGEIMNISLGASATAVSTMLNARVDITTPVVSVVEKEEFRMDKVEPAVGVEINYISGLEGRNVMLLKRHDVKVIVEMLMGISMTDEEFEMNEMNISAVCEVMNQMMGASSTALSEFLGRMVNISTPISSEIENDQAFIEKYFVDDQPKVVIGFELKIEDKLQSEFFNVMPIELAKSLVSGFLPEEQIMQTEEQTAQKAEDKPQEAGSQGTLSQEEIEKLLMGASAESAEPETPVMEAPVQPQPQLQPNMAMAQQPAGMSMDASVMQMQMMQQMMAQMQMMQRQMEEQKEETKPKLINVSAPSSPAFSADGSAISDSEKEENIELIMGVPLEISVEIGRTKKLVKDILEFTKGSLVVLDKLAGEQVELFVNGQCIARGDVVVVEDNFGVRITEIMKINFAALE